MTPERVPSFSAWYRNLYCSCKTKHKKKSQLNRMVLCIIVISCVNAIRGILAIIPLSALSSFSEFEACKYKQGRQLSLFLGLLVEASLWLAEYQCDQHQHYGTITKHMRICMFVQFCFQLILK